MNNLSLKLKIILIFIVPAIALAYFSILFTMDKYQKLNESSIHKLSANITSSFSSLAHEIQKERGLSAGYIVAPDKTELKNTLLSQYILTNKAFKELKVYIMLESEDKALLQTSLHFKNKPIIKNILKSFYNMEKIRAKVLKQSIKFEDEIQFYTNINTNIISSVKLLTNLLQKQSNLNVSLMKLQSLKEKAGLERAYIYNQLLSKKFNDKIINTIRELHISQTSLKNQFLLFGSVNSHLIFHKYMDIKLEDEIIQFKKHFFNNKLGSVDSIKWFTLSTKRIDKLEEISNIILNKYLIQVNKTHSKALSSLYVTAILLVLSLTALIVLIFIIRKLMSTEEKNIENLRIASYTFDSHEAMTITDVNGTIIKVNKAFSRITGYEASEVIGKNPRVLKSMKHNDEFYKNMWHKIHTVGRWSDDIYNKRKDGEVYLERLSITAIKDNNNITTHYIAQFLDISDIQKAKELAQYQADHDFLTGILNRKSLTNRLSEEFTKARRHNFLHAFLFIDLDAFKSVNDNYGHDIGDKALIEISSTITSLLREEDLCARIGGDEFAVILLNINNNEDTASKDVKIICQKIIDEVSLPFMIGEHKIKIGASIGVKLFPDNEKSAHEVMLHADAAMYQAKEQGKNRFVFFDKSIELELKQFALMEEELLHAIKNDEITFYFQPKVNTLTNNIQGAELLVRWEHPIKGLLYPDKFLKIATEINIIPQITKMALEHACKFLSTNKNNFNGSLSINIDSTELLNDNFKKNICLVIEKYNVNPSKIEFEITERELIKDFTLTNEKINELKEYGIKFSIDDFGVEYSSITYIQKLSVDTLKVDKSFLNDLSNTSNKELLKMIINLSKVFKMDIVIEGIEEESQLQFIKECNANIYQGYYFSKAIPQEMFSKLL